MNEIPTGRGPVPEVLDSLVGDLSVSAPNGADVVRRARKRARTRRLGGVAASAVAVLGVAAGLSVTLPHGSGGQGPAAADDGWTWITSRGLEIEVPASWAINPLCPQGPSVVRAVGEAPMVKCAAPPEGVVYPRVVLDELLDENGRLPTTPEGGGWTTWAPVSLAGGQEAWTATATAGGYVLHVTDATATTSGGEPALSATVEPAERSSRVTALTVPALHTGITVTDADEATTKRIINSVRVISGQDRLGCPATSPGLPAALTAPEGGPRLTVPGDVREGTVCSYGADGLLTASTALDLERTSALVSALRKAPAGVNPPPDLAAVSCVAGADNAGVQLRLKDADGATSTVWASYLLCAARYGLSDGTGTAQVTEEVLAAALAPLRTGYSITFEVRS